MTSFEVYLFKSTFTDFDECQSDSSNNCEQVCVNVPASFFCDCRDGYRLNGDGSSCDGKSFYCLWLSTYFHANAFWLAAGMV